MKKRLLQSSFGVSVAALLAGMTPEVSPAAVHTNWPYQSVIVKTASNGQPNIASHARAAVLMDAATGQVLYEKDGQERLPMASITKIMTMLLVMRAVDDGKIKLTDSVKVSEHAASMGGSQIFLEPGESMTVEQMLKGIAIVSANDACVAMAEHLYGSEEAFVAKMNQCAEELGMTNTHFSNCNGLPVANHYSSARDIAIMSRELLKHDEITKWTSVYSDYLRKDSDHPLWLVNTNKLVRFYDGVDGLKTGFTREAMYCLSATAKREGFRVIAVVMGEPKPTVRNADVTGMLNYAFANYRSETLYREGQTVTNVRVERGVHDYVAAQAEDTVGVVLERGRAAHLQKKIIVSPVKAPIHEDQVVGRLEIYDGKNCVGKVDLVAGSDVAKAGFIHHLGKTIRGVVTFGQAGSK